MVQASHISGSFFGYWVLTSQNGNWQIRAEAGIWRGASETAAVFALGQLAKAGLDEAAVVAALGRFSKRPLVGACTADRGVPPAC